VSCDRRRVPQTVRQNQVASIPLTVFVSGLHKVTGLGFVRRGHTDLLPGGHSPGVNYCLSEPRGPGIVLRKDLSSLAHSNLGLKHPLRRIDKRNTSDPDVSFTSPHSKRNLKISVRLGDRPERSCEL